MAGLFFRFEKKELLPTFFLQVHLKSKPYAAQPENLETDFTKMLETFHKCKESFVGSKIWVRNLGIYCEIFLQRIICREKIK